MSALWCCRPSACSIFPSSEHCLGSSHPESARVRAYVSVRAARSIGHEGKHDLVYARELGAPPELGRDPATLQNVHSALVGAARGGHVEVVKLLLAVGASPVVRVKVGVVLLFVFCV